MVVDARSDSVLLALDPENTLDEAQQQQRADHEAAALEEAARIVDEPRTLQGAVQALAKFTSETVVGKPLRPLLDL